MLSYISIRNFALIDKVELQLESGFNVLTGETGAGKSIIIDAVGLLIGERASQELIRTGSDVATVEASFNLTAMNDELTVLLNEYGIEIEDDRTLIISREIHRNGRGVARINGRLTTATILKDVGSFLVDIHGQNEHQSIMNVDRHLGILDNYIGEKLSAKLRVYRAIYSQLKENRKKQKELGGDSKERARTIELIEYQFDEITQAHLSIDEERELEREKQIITNREKLFTAIETAKQCLYEHEDSLSAYDLVGKAADALLHASSIDDQCASMRERCENVLFLLDDLHRDVRNYRESIDFNPARTEEVQTRLEMIFQLKRKYGGTIAEIHEYGESLYNQLQTLKNSDNILVELGKEEELMTRDLSVLAEEISAMRNAGAQKLQQAVMNELKELGMNKVDFQIALNRSEDVGSLSVGTRKYKFYLTGIDTAEFLISTNPGEPVKPLVKIASGGEVSRIMLGIKAVLAFTENIPTLIFDEIDAGIGGKAAQSVARRLRRISKSCQVMCVTHLPQIAASAQIHFYISKNIDQKRAETKIQRLNDAERIREIARMLAGDQLTDTAVRHAKEMIDNGVLDV